MKGQFKLTDFGIISDLKDRSEQQQMAEAKTFVGTLLYMSVSRTEANTQHSMGT
jgi:serine/threonine protein kinase